MTQQLDARTASAPRKKSGWPVAIGLIVLGLVPVFAGGLRLTELAGLEVAPSDTRFSEAPAPIVAHIIGASVYILLGALQFVPGLRRRRWHRYAGRVLVPAGLITGLSGIWMGIFYPRPALDTGLRVFFGLLLVTFIALGVRAVLKRDFTMHRAWMIRGYAIGAGAGTQVLTALGWFLLTGEGEPSPDTAMALLAAGWVINMIVAEFAIRRSVR